MKSKPKSNRAASGRKKHRSGWKIALTVLAGLLLVVAVGGGMFIKSKLNKINYVDGSLPKEENTSSVQQPADPGAPADPDPESSADEGLWQGEEEIDISGLNLVESSRIPSGSIYTDKNILNILLLGTDYPFNKNDPGRADAILILSLDFRDNSARLVSMERGMGMPMLSGKFAGQWDWFTHLHHFGGANMMLESIRYCFKLDVDRFAQVNFDSFKSVVDALGGIDIEMTEVEANRLGLRTGWNHLDGAAALSYARLRSVDSDWVRITRQRRVIQACVDQIKGADLATLNQLADVILPMISTNFTQMEILSLMTKAPKFMGVQFEQMTIPAPGTYGGMTVRGGKGAFAADFEENSRILREFLYGDGE